MNYAQALRYLYRLTDYERQPAISYTMDYYNLDRLRQLLDRLGRPQDRFRAVQVAGTKGKGSTAAMLTAMLHAAGQRVGLYTSPHLHTFRERIRVGEDLISEETFAKLMTHLATVVDAFHQERAGEPLTTFEVATALAFLHFAQAAADTVVLEAGIGGELDATNVVDPVLSILTPVSLDHVAVLGNTLAAIAEKKAGIIKPGVPAVIAPQPAEALVVFERACQERDAPPILVGRDWAWTVRALTPAGVRLDVVGPGRAYADLRVPLAGAFQALNTTVALAAAVQLGLSESAIRTGLARVWWPARLEVLARRPWVIADGAHNGDSASKLAMALGDVFRPRRIILVLGLSRGHALEDVLEPLLPRADHVVVTRSRHPRAADVDSLRAGVAALGREADAVEPVDRAVEHAVGLARPADLVCITGSLFVAAEARAVFGAPGSELQDPVPY